MRLTLAARGCLISLGLVACGGNRFGIDAGSDGLFSPSGAALDAIAITPANPTLYKITSSTQQFTATGTYADDSTGDLTAQVTWKATAGLVAGADLSMSNDPDAQGLAALGGGGTFALSATLGAITGTTTVTVVPSYFQQGVVSSPGDQVALDDSQGFSTQIYVTNAQVFADDGTHYFWVATEVHQPGAEDVFAQVGYGLSGAGSAAFPFYYTEFATNDSGNGLEELRDISLTNDQWYTFALATDGGQQDDGTYLWTFTLQPQGGDAVVLGTVPLPSPNGSAPYLLSEVAGAINACAATYAVPYGAPGSPAAMLALHAGQWQPVAHVVSVNYYADCPQGSVTTVAFQQLSTQMGPNVTQGCNSCQIW